MTSRGKPWSRICLVLALTCAITVRAAVPTAARSPKATPTPPPLPIQTATTHPMKYYLSLPKNWSAKRKWPVLVAPSAHYGDKGATLRMFARERDARMAEFIVVQPFVINADPMAKMAEYRGEVADAIRAADAATDGRDEIARGKFDREGVMAVIRDVQTLYQGETKVYLAGFSSSTHIATMFVFAHPELIKGAVINSGGYAGRGVDEEHIPLVNSPERARMEIKVIVGEEDRGYQFYSENWAETKAKLLGYGHRPEKLQMEVINKGNPEKLSPGHGWYAGRIMDFILEVEQKSRTGNTHDEQRENAR